MHGSSIQFQLHFKIKTCTYTYIVNVILASAQCVPPSPHNPSGLVVNFDLQLLHPLYLN